MTNSATLGSFGDASNAPLVFRNKIINGGFDIWQRGTSQTSSGYGSVDRWQWQNSGSTFSASRQTFGLGQTDVPNNPKYLCRTAVTSVAGASNYCQFIQRIEGVATLSGQTATLSFWAKADASKNIAIEFSQSFGTGGSPSANVNSIGVTTVALTATWAKYTVTVSIPSISGKTLGTNNDDYLQVITWFDAGSSFNARTNSLGQQSGTFDIAQVQLEAGLAPTPFEQRPIGLELSLCQRYCFKSSGQVALVAIAQGGLGNNVACNFKFPTTFRNTPNATWSAYSPYSNGTAQTAGSPTFVSSLDSVIYVQNCFSSGPGYGSSIFLLFTDLTFSAEL